ncbi:MAG: polysaccharide biosynthesis/export family protein [Candidatus Omnitrophica bacterium]|nr:polysaccharide biosynthesis/export family protein [Candidatus Omnitrophota bacterium]
MGVHRNSFLWIKTFLKLLPKVIFLLSVGKILLFPYASYSKTPQEEAKEHYRLGEIYYQHGLYKEAEREFKKALQLLKGEVPLEEEGSFQKEEKPPSPYEESQYIISPGDVLYISVWENPDLTGEVIVRPDGMISFPLIDEVKAAGLTISELDKEMTERLKEYIRFPDVSISLRAMGGQRVIILGEVKSPGVYSLKGRKTVLEAVALAGGFTKDAVLNSVIVIKGGFKNPQPKRIDLASALKKGKMKEDIVLDSQDIVFVPKKFIADLNYFLTQILGPISRGVYTAKEIQRW